MLRLPKHAAVYVVAAAIFIAALAIFLTTEIFGIKHDGKRHSALEKLATINLALELYKKDFGRCPSPKEGWTLVLNTYKLPESIKTDPWGHSFSYAYLANGLRCEVYSLGENGLDEKMKGDDLFLKPLE